MRRPNTYQGLCGAVGVKAKNKKNTLWDRPHCAGGKGGVAEEWGDSHQRSLHRRLCEVIRDHEQRTHVTTLGE